MSFQIGFIVTAVIVIIQIVKQLQRLKRATPTPPDSMAARRSLVHSVGTTYDTSVTVH
jgi:hypothetical protein